MHIVVHAFQRFHDLQPDVVARRGTCRGGALTLRVGVVARSLLRALDVTAAAALVTAVAAMLLTRVVG